MENVTLFLLDFVGIKGGSIACGTLNVNLLSISLVNALVLHGLKKIKKACIV